MKAVLKKNYTNRY